MNPIRLVACFSLAAVFAANFSLLDAKIARAGSEENADTLYYVYVSDIGGAAGGRVAESKSFYLAFSGLFQISRENTGGDLISLVQGRADAKVLFDWIAARWDAIAASPPPVPPDPGMSTEYYEPETEICVASGKGHSICRLYRDIPPILSDLIRQGRTLVGASVPESEKSGVWGKIRPLGPGETSFITVDHVFDAGDLQAQPELAELFDHPLKLTQLSAKKYTDPKLMDLLTPGRFSYIELDGNLYILFVYKL